MLAISTDQPHELLALIRELARTTAATRDAFTPAASAATAVAAPYAAASLGDKTTRSPRKQGMATAPGQRGMALSNPQGR